MGWSRESKTAPDCSISVTVTDEATGEALPFATVRSGTKQAQTDPSGRCSLKLETERDHDITIKLDGYHTITVNVYHAAKWRGNLRDLGCESNDLHVRLYSESVPDPNVTEDDVFFSGAGYGTIALVVSALVIIGLSIYLWNGKQTRKVN